MSAMSAAGAAGAGLSGVAAALARVQAAAKRPRDGAARAAPPARRRRPRTTATTATTTTRTTTTTTTTATRTTTRTRTLAKASRAETVARNVAYWQGAAYSPDGLCVLTAGDDGALRVYEHEALDAPVEAEAALRCAEGDRIFDYAWYPGMDSAVPGTCCFASSARGQPVHLWDAYSGALRASYKCVNALDEVSTALSISFDNAGQRLYAGVERGIYAFDVGRPGAQATFSATSPSRKSRWGQRGILSCFAMHPTDPGKFMVGSYEGTIAMYADHDPSTSLYMVPAHKGGVTQIQFGRCGTKVYTGGRRDERLLVWDLRKLEVPVGWFHRDARTNQRISFDLDAVDDLLVTGSACGRALVYHTSDAAPLDRNAPAPAFVTEKQGAVVNAASFRASSKQFVAATGDRALAHRPQSAYDTDESDGEPGPRPETGRLALYDVRKLEPVAEPR